MLQIAPWRLYLVLIVALFGIAFAAPNFVPERYREQLPGFLPRGTLNLGLDLRGGVHLLLEVDTTELQRRQLENISDQMAAVLREAEPTIRTSGRGVVADAARIRVNNPDDLARARAVLRTIARSPTSSTDTLVFTEGADGLIEARMTEQYVRELSRQAAEQSREVIRRRIDPTGTSEVTIIRQGDQRIVVQAPGLTDPRQLRERIGQTALMTFHMVRELDPADAQSGRIPVGAMVVQPYPGIGSQPELVERRARFTGERLTSAQPSTDQDGQIVMSFRLDATGSRLFCRITSDYTGQRFAILLDNQVLTAPRINEPICGGSGQISGNFTAQSASELALMLRAGALPAPLTVIEERSVGPGLGQDSIDAGIRAGIISGIGVLVFMVLAYGLFGLFACVALIVNGILVLAAMSMIGAALTLPGIAGLILTLAMAVDANVLIYERMRDEQKAGRGPAIAIDAGFGKAMVAIVDANLTTILAALILFQFGAGPVRGFAWTLSIGVITSVFTAVLISQLLIAWWFRATRPKKLPI